MNTPRNIFLRTFQQRFIATDHLGASCVVVCILTVLLVFLLPFIIPVGFQPAISASYAAGFNNHTAVLAASGISVAVAGWSWQRSRLRNICKPSSNAAPEPRIPVWLMVVMIAFTCSSTALAAWAIHQAGERYLADAGYFIEQMSAHAGYGGALYTDLEFAYGPLLFYPTIWLQRLLHCSMFTAYFMTLAAEQTLGLLELAYILNTLSLRASVRRFAFVLFAFGAVDPLLGLNYTFFRYLTPVALLLVVLKFKRADTSLLALAAAQVVSLAISAEVGFAFAAAAMVLVLLRARDNGWRWMTLLLGPVVGAALFVSTAGRSYFHMLQAFAKGALNLPVAPYPHLLIFLFSVVWLVPLAVGHTLASSESGRYATVASYVYAVALLPAALGRCDPLHVFFDGLIFCLLSFMAVAHASLRRRAMWSACMIIFILWEIGTVNWLFRLRTADTLSVVLPSRIAARLARAAGEGSDLGDALAPNDDPGYKLDVTRLEQWVGSATVATPLEISPETESALKRSRHYERSYFAYLVDTFSGPAERRKIEEMNRSEWALVPEDYDRPFIELPGNLYDLQGLPLPIPQRHASPFLSGLAMEENLEKNWTTKDKLGPYLLLKRMTPISSEASQAPAPSATSH